MANIIINTATGSLEINRDRAEESSSIQQRSELIEGVTVALGDGAQNPALLTLKFKAQGTSIANMWATYDAIKQACKNAVSITIEGVTKPITALKSFKHKPNILNLDVEASYIMKNAYPLVSPNPNYLPANAFLLADGQPFLLADGVQALEA